VKHFIKITLRRLSREKVYTSVNILGLAMGMASALLIFFFLRFETSYDTFHRDHQRIYRIGTDLRVLDQKQGYAVSSAALAPALAREYHQIESFLRLFHIHYFLRDIIYQYDEVRFHEKEMFAVDSTYFDFFTTRFLEGTAENSLYEPFSIVLTEDLARKIFGDKKALGEKILMRNVGYFTVTAVIQNPPLNQHFRFKGLISMSSLHHMSPLFLNAFGPGVSWEVFENSMGSTVVWSYIKTAENADAEDFIKTNWGDFHQKYIHPLTQSHQVDKELIIQPIRDIHLHSDLIYEISDEISTLRVMNPQMIRVFFLIAIFLLIVAAINYTNIAISHFNKRRKEMGIIKVIGSGSRRLFAGFFGEAFVTAFLALAIALFLLEMIIPSVNKLLHVDLSLNVVSDFMVLLILLAIYLVTAVLSGLFPALYFSVTPPLKLLVSRLHPGRKSLIMKKVLVVVQFTISVFMLTATMIIYQQLRHLQERDLGYPVENIVTIEIHDDISKKNVMVLDSILRLNPAVEKTALSNYIFTMFPIKHTVLIETDAGNTVRSFNTIQTSEEYLEMLDITITANGEVIDFQNLDLNKGVIVNQAFLDSIGFDNPVGNNITTHYQFLGGRLSRTREIIGVMENIQYAWLNQPVEPLVILPMGIRAHYLSLKFTHSERAQHENIIKNAWKLFDPGNPLVIHYLEDSVETYYSQQASLTRFFSYFAWLCIVISFLGIFGITAYNLEQRTTEIGIRKVMGATPYDIFAIFFHNYSAPLVVACLAGSISGWYILNLWLKSFTYAVSISLIPFLVAVLLACFTVVLAITIHVARISNLNPSIALKYE
jgi:putative ABC transport system permease protein